MGDRATTPWVPAVAFFGGIYYSVSVQVSWGSSERMDMASGVCGFPEECSGSSPTRRLTVHGENMAQDVAKSLIVGVSFGASGADMGAKLPLNFGMAAGHKLYRHFIDMLTRLTRG